MARDGAVDRLADLLEYPTASFASRLDACRSLAPALPLPAAEGLERFATAVAGLTTAELQERYTETFDLSDRCTMDLGWHLYGERYERGMFLSDLRPRLAAAGIDEGDELPDYLPRLLVLLDRSDRTSAAALRDTIRPAVEALRAALAERGSPYVHLVASAFTAATSGA